MNAPARPVSRRATNVSLDQAIVSEAKALGVNVSRACEDGLRAEVRRAREAAWLAENLPAMEAWQAWHAKHGHPLADFLP